MMLQMYTSNEHHRLPPAKIPKLGDWYAHLPQSQAYIPAQNVQHPLPSCICTHAPELDGLCHPPNMLSLYLHRLQNFAACEHVEF